MFVPTAAPRLDAEDPIASLRDRFVIPDDTLVYLDGNSLGRLPRATVDRLRADLDVWATRLIGGWDDGWMELPETVGDELGQAVLGADAGQVVIADSTSVCLYKLARAALAMRPGRIIADAHDFPTDRYILEGLGAPIDWIDSDPGGGPEAADVGALIREDTTLIVLSHVNYRSAQIADLAAITELAHDAGAFVLWDLSHSAGALPLRLDADGVDLAVGCTYKYLNAGPGAPAFMYVRRALLDAVRQPIWGWIGREDRFGMASGYVPATGPARLLSGTPPVLAIGAVREGVRLIAEAGIDRIREKSSLLTAFAIDCVDALPAELGCTVGSPRDPTRRGSHVAVRHPRARTLVPALRDRGVITDFREPDVIRLGLSPLTTRFADVADGIDAIADRLSRP